MSGILGRLQGAGTLQGGEGHTNRAESDVREGGKVGIVVEDPLPAQSPGRGISTFSVTLRSKTQSPSKLGGNGG